MMILLKQYLKKETLIIIFSLSFISLYGQESYPSGYFRVPLDIRMFLSGTFGELRPGHFHSGIDIRTGGMEGKNVYAAADGYVSRIVVSPSGYGKALYITHPNGFVSVYGHLKEFNKTIGAYVRKEQYKKESFALDIGIGKDSLPVKKDDIIALSGTSGDSGGPHLHFEIRDAVTQKTINPILFGLDANDLIRPEIQAIKVYTMDDCSLINGHNDSLILNTGGWGMGYHLLQDDTIDASGNIAFGIHTFDLQNDNTSHHGIYSVELYRDSVLMFSFSAGIFSFDETRYINALIDYAEYMASGRRFIQTFVAPGDKLSMYKKVYNNGIFRFDDNGLHRLEYVVKDAEHNTSVLTFFIRSHQQDTKQESLSSWKPSSPLSFYYDQENSFDAPGIMIRLEKGCLYNDLNFKYSSTERLKNTLSVVHHVHDRFTPVHMYYDLWIKPDSLPGMDWSKTYIVKIEDGKFVAEEGVFQDGYVSTKVREFGDYAVAIDTVPPVIKSFDVANNKNISGLNVFRFEITDAGSGIKSYRGTLNGDWILMDYDAKNNLLQYEKDDRLKKGANRFRLIVTDMKDNKKTSEATIIN
jgi:murein DD-endopeptidase MepM/ murein hydrolase activator NlpD